MCLKWRRSLLQKLKNTCSVVIPHLLKSSSSLAICVPILPAYIIVPGVVEMPGIIGRDFLPSSNRKNKKGYKRNRYTVYNTVDDYHTICTFNYASEISMIEYLHRLHYFSISTDHQMSWSCLSVHSCSPIDLFDCGHALSWDGKTSESLINIHLSQVYI